MHAIPHSLRLERHDLRAALSVIVGLLLLAALQGCAETRPPLADTWGSSVRMAIENQKLSPAPASDAPVVGLDGPYAKATIDAYRKGPDPDAQGGKSKGSPVELMLSTKGGK